MSSHGQLADIEKVGTQFGTQSSTLTPNPAGVASLRPLRWIESPMTEHGGAGTSDEFALPIGTVTFLLTDIEGSTKAWAASPELMRTAVIRHYEILDQAISTHGGVRPQEQGEGDSVVGAFSRASDAIKAAVEAQAMLADEPWLEGTPKIAVRMAVHAGEAQLRNEANYVGQAIIRTARLRAIAHGGQVIASQAVRDLSVDQLGSNIELLDLGVHRLKDLARPEHVWQVIVPDRPSTFPPLNSLDSTPNNLPSALSTFVGRHSEVEAVVALVRGNRLVTVTGTGGAGKTRLAQQAAGQLADQFADGAWWVELAPIAADDVARTTAHVLSLKDPDTMVAKLAEQNALLVFDNCEHVLDSVAPLIEQIMRNCPNVTVLATSRGSIDVPGEVTWRVPPLSLPEPTALHSLERLAQFDAVRLFVDRAKRARPNFVLTNANGPAVAEICFRLDGLPLAIELAAARTKSLTPQQLLGGLENALGMLTSGSRVVLARQKTLEASILWSYELLGDAEKTLLRRVSVFADGWDLEAAERVCADDSITELEVLDALERLIDQSLITAVEATETVRYRALETVRQFGAARLAEHNEAVEIGQRHADYYGSLAAAVAPECEGPNEDAALARLNPEQANFGTALRFQRTNATAEDFCRLVFALTPLWAVESQTIDGLAACTTALDLVGDRSAELKARILQARAECHMALGSFVFSFFDANACVETVESASLVVPIGRARAFKAAMYLGDESGHEMMRQAEAELASHHDAFGSCWAKNRTVPWAVISGNVRLTAETLDSNRKAAYALGNPRQIFEWSIWDGIAHAIRGDHQAARAASEISFRLKPNSVTAAALRRVSDARFAADEGQPPVPVAELQAIYANTTKMELAFVAGLVLFQVIGSLFEAEEFDQAKALAEQNFTTPIPGVRQTDNIILAGLCSFCLGNLDDATALLIDAETDSANRITWQISALHLRSLLEHASADLTAAEANARTMLGLAAENQLRHETIAAIEVLAIIATTNGLWIEAARLLGFIDQRRGLWLLRRQLEPIATIFAPVGGAAHDALGEERFSEEFAAGASLSLDSLVEYVNRSHGERSRPTIGWGALTPTERRVAELVRAGRSNAEVAKKLLMGVETVKTHISRVYAKLSVANRTQLAALPDPNHRE